MSYRKTLEREGIKPATTTTIFGSKFGQASTLPYKASAQNFQYEQFSEKKNAVGTKKLCSVIDTGEQSTVFLTKSEWLTMGDGWYQCTPVGSGSTTRCGLHSVIDSAFGQFYMCLYQPQTKEAVNSCMSNNPEYNLQLSSKILTKLSGNG
jgi:hypothetical protein